MSADPGWLVKDFNVLYRVTRALLLAVGEGDETKIAHALNDVAAQLERLREAFAITEAFRMAADLAHGLNPDVTQADIEQAIALVEAAKERSS